MHTYSHLQSIHLISICFLEIIPTSTTCFYFPKIIFPVVGVKKITLSCILWKNKHSFLIHSFIICVCRNYKEDSEEEDDEEEEEESDEEEESEEEEYRDTGHSCKENSLLLYY